MHIYQALQSAFLPADAANGVVRALSGFHMEQVSPTLSMVEALSCIISLCLFTASCQCAHILPCVYCISKRPWVLYFAFLC